MMKQTIPDKVLLLNKTKEKNTDHQIRWFMHAAKTSKPSNCNKEITEDFTRFKWMMQNTTTYTMYGMKIYTYT